jgi:hypothetical protein
MSYKSSWHHISQPSREAGERLSRALSSLPTRVPPADLTVALRVIASRERRRLLEGRTLPRTIEAWLDRVRMESGEMMRSLVLPMAGGICTAVVLFSTWLVPTYPLHVNGGVDVVPIMLSRTEATVSATAEGTGAIGLSGDAVVDVTVDNQGRVVDIAIVSGTDLLQNADRRHRLENVLLRTQFAPATALGRPVSSVVRMVSSQIDVTD